MRKFHPLHIIPLVLILYFLIVGVILFINSLKTEQLHLSFSMDPEFFDSCFSSPHNSISPFPDAKAIVVPHHLIVCPETAAVFEATSPTEPKIIILLGTDHENRGKSDLTTTDIGFDTPYGKLPIDKFALSALLASHEITLDQSLFDNEHSISTIVPFIKHSFPEAQIVPIAMNSHVDRYSAEKLGQLLHEVLPTDALLIASIDFSHYKTLEEADIDDQYTATVIHSQNFDKIYSIEADSPAALFTVMTYLTKRNGLNLSYEYHTNSASYTNKPNTPSTTSHFYWIYE